jgi:hypothetical protein
MTNMKQLPLEPIRQAVNCGEFDRAQLLWNQCVTGLEEELSGHRLSEARLAEVRELVEWSRTVVLCERVRLQNRLDRLQADLRVAEEYELAVPLPTHRLVAASF